MTTLRDDLSPADLELLARLARVAAVIDPEPPHLRELGRAALSVRRVDAELAALVADSQLMTGAVRSTGLDNPRVLTFRLAGVLVEVQISQSPKGRQLIGVLEGLDRGSADRVLLETAGNESFSSPVDLLGRFEFAWVGRGLVRLRVLAGGADVTTEWFGL